MPDVNAFLAAAEAESKMPSVSVGMASGQLPPALVELMRRGVEPTATVPGAPAPLPPEQHALADRLVTLFRTLPPAHAAEFQNSVADFIDKWMSQHQADA